jgi:dihydroxy-acid dehydratase
MDTKGAGFEEPRFLNFPQLPDGTTRDGQPVLNKYSTTITKNHDFPGAQVCLT